MCPLYGIYLPPGGFLSFSSNVPPGTVAALSGSGGRGSIYVTPAGLHPSAEPVRPAEGQLEWQSLPRPSEPLAKAAQSEAGHPLSVKEMKPKLPTQAGSKGLRRLRGWGWGGEGPCGWQFRLHPFSFSSQPALHLGHTGDTLRFAGI